MSVPIHPRLAIDGRELTNLYITDYGVKLEVLDGDGTGRSKAPYWPMIRDPEGVIHNLTVEIATTNSKEPDFIYLWEKCLSMGKQEFVSVRFIDPTGTMIEQKMYIVTSELKYKRIQLDGIVMTDVLQVSFIAERGR